MVRCQSNVLTIIVGDTRTDSTLLEYMTELYFPLCFNIFTKNYMIAKTELLDRTCADKLSCKESHLSLLTPHPVTLSQH